MGRRAPRPVGNAMEGLLAHLAPQTLLADVQRLWPGVVGETIAAEATPTADRGGTLTITCKSAVWAQELDLMGPDLVARLNTALGADLVVALRCSAAPSRGWAAQG
ncbi:MAG: DciA family protein [Solirubrobacteraceae bacterium]